MRNKKLSIFNFPFSILNTRFSSKDSNLGLATFSSHERGFTLLELLISISILVTVGAIALSSIVIILRSAKKSQQLLLARQNGNSVLSQMVRGIRYAESLDAPAACVPSVKPNPPSLTITSSFDSGQTTYDCDNNTISSNSATLIDNNNFSISACQFTCSQTSVSSPPIITISFTIQTKSQSNFFESSVAIPFESSVTMRNVNH